MGTVTIPTPNSTASYVVSITTGQWSGSGNDRYITVQGGNISANSQLLPWYDNASQSLLNGPVWVVPSNGQFTIHTTAIPAGTVTIAVMVAGIVGEAQYQVLSDVYSKSQVDSIVAQSTAITYYTEANLTNVHASVTMQTSRLRVVGGTMCFASIAFKTTGSIGSYTTLFTLPTACKPSGETNINITGINQKSYPCTIDSNGVVKPRSSVDAQDWLQGSVSYTL